jgi:cytochrome c2
MDTLGNAILGFVFLALSAASTFLMFYLWGFPFDHEKLKSTAPPKLMLLHRIIGYAYGAIYIFLMFQMVPRLWSYEIEFPARTVAHLLLGMSIGAILFVKIAVVRFFKHLESTLVPFLGTGLFICTFLLIGLSVPFALKEVYLHRSAIGGTAFSPENIERVKKLLPNAGFGANASLNELATPKSFSLGRDVLLSKCVQCHDLRTVLIKPRTPEQWVQTVSRMAERAVFNPISEQEQWYAATYLIAISPDLQKGFKQKKQNESEAIQSQETVSTLASEEQVDSSSATIFDLATAQAIFEMTCSKCHQLSNIENSPPKNIKQVKGIVARMVMNGLQAPEEELAQIVFYLEKTYCR